MSWLCNIGLHKIVRPLEKRRVPYYLKDTELCVRCRNINSLSGWYRLDDKTFNEYFNEEYLRSLEKSCAYQALGYKLPFKTQVDIVERMGFDVTEERKDLELLSTLREV